MFAAKPPRAGSIPTGETECECNHATILRLIARARIQIEPSGWQLKTYLVAVIASV